MKELLLVSPWSWKGGRESDSGQVQYEYSVHSFDCFCFVSETIVRLRIAKVSEKR